MIGRGKRGNKKSDLIKIVILIILALLLIFLIIKFLVPFIIGISTGNAVSASTGETKIIKQGEYAVVNGITIFVENAVQTTSFPFASIIAGFNYSKNSTSKNGVITIDGKMHSFELTNGTTNSAAAIRIYSSGIMETKIINENQYKSFDKFKKEIKIHKDNLVTVGNKDYKFLLKVSDVYRGVSGGSTGSGDRLKFLDIFSGNTISATLTKNTGTASTGTIVLKGGQYNVSLEGKPGINNLLYNITIKPTNPDYSAIYSTSNGISAFVKSAEQKSARYSSSFILGSEVFVGGPNNSKTNIIINGKTYLIEVTSATTYSSAAIKVSPSKTCYRFGFVPVCF